MRSIPEDCIIGELSKMTLKFDYKLIPTEGGYTVPAPYRGSDGAAGLDLHAALDGPVTIQPGARAGIPLGIAAAVPHGYVGLLCSRSSLGVKHGLMMANSVGVIDEDYRGQWQVWLINTSDTPYTVQPGDRVCQVLLLPYAAGEPHEAEELSGTERGTGGFGSTGK